MFRLVVAGSQAIVKVRNGYYSVPCGWKGLHLKSWLYADQVRIALGAEEVVHTRVPNNGRSIRELGFVPFSREGAEFLFNLLAKRHQRRPTIVTTDLSFSEWVRVFGDEKLTAALLDRLTENAHILTTTGASYRLRSHKKKVAQQERLRRRLAESQERARPHTGGRQTARLSFSMMVTV